MTNKPPKIPLIQRALVSTGPGTLALKAVPVPRVAPDEVLVRTAAVALNPSDHKLLDQSTTKGAISGADLAGIVVAVGSAHDSYPHLKVGDRVCAFAFGANPGNPHNGAFAQYVVAPARLCVKLPENFDFATAASLPMGLFTAGFIFRSLGLEMKLPDQPPAVPTHQEFLLIYGGGTATGTLTLQLLRKAGYRVITMCSTNSFELAKSRGAEAVFDYRSPTVCDDIREYTQDQLGLVVDCIGTSETMTLCYSCIGDTGGRYTALERYPRRLTIRRRDVTHDWAYGWTIFGKEVKLAGAYYRPEIPEDRVMGESWAEELEKLLQTSGIVPHPLDIHTGGLGLVPSKLELMRKGNVRGKKIVIMV
ncbi:GroES-like protein [Xylariomycetidae sp. FL2044]|nr:GroES-like protein [Xylariomycetidae sp. FL2044]